MSKPTVIMITRAPLLLAILLLAFGCKQSERETASGFKYTLLKEGSGDPAKAGEILVFNFELRDSKDSLWNSSYRDGLPAAMRVPDTTGMSREDGMTQMLRELRKGDSVTANLTMKQFFEDLIGRPVPAEIDSTLSLNYTINVNDVMEMEEFLAWRNNKVKERDETMIKNYLQNNGINAKRDSSGLYYVIHNEAGNEKPEMTSCVEVKYEGRFLKDGRPFDRSERIGFNLNRVIPGWTLGVSKLGVGDSATLYIPSALAYGDRGAPPTIPPDAVLVFDVTLLNVGSETDPKTRLCK